jgi:hypothetical protein
MVLRLTSAARHSDRWNAWPRVYESAREPVDHDDLTSGDRGYRAYAGARGAKPCLETAISGPLLTYPTADPMSGSGAGRQRHAGGCGAYVTGRRVCASTGACRFTRGRVWSAVGPWLGEVSGLCGRPGGPAVRRPERALHTSPGQRPGNQGIPPSRHPEGGTYKGVALGWYVLPFQGTDLLTWSCVQPQRQGTLTGGMPGLACTKARASRSITTT